MPELFPSKAHPIAAAREAIQRGDVTCEEIVHRCLKQIDRHEATVRAWVQVDAEGALQRARELDSLAKPRGPLCGIPVGVKDIVDVAGLPTAAGSERLANSVASQDAAIVRTLRQAGAIMLGKTVTTQFACFDPPVTTNPWDAQLTPGGSSSGSAAAVATGMCLAAIGTQTGGSVTRPAAYCGVSSLKPGFRRLEMTGIYPVAPSLDQAGFMAVDLSGLVTIMSAFQLPPVEVLSNPPTLVPLQGIFAAEASAEIRTAIERFIAALESSGARLMHASTPVEEASVIQHHRTIMCFETWKTHEQRFREFPDDYLPGITMLLRQGREVTPADYSHACNAQRRLQSDMDSWFANHPGAILITPATPGIPPGTESTGNPIFNSPFSLTGLPTISIPFALSAAGLPLAVQLIAARDCEAELFAAGLWCEQNIRHAENYG